MFFNLEITKHKYFQIFNPSICSTHCQQNLFNLLSGFILPNSSRINAPTTIGKLAAPNNARHARCTIRGCKFIPRSQSPRIPFHRFLGSFSPTCGPPSFSTKTPRSSSRNRSRTSRRYASRANTAARARNKEPATRQNLPSRAGPAAGGRGMLLTRRPSAPHIVPCTYPRIPGPGRPRAGAGKNGPSLIRASGVVNKPCALSAGPARLFIRGEEALATIAFWLIKPGRPSA